MSLLVVSLECDGGGKSVGVPFWLLRSWYHLGGWVGDWSSEDARELQLRIVFFADGSADLHCSPGEDLDLGVEIFVVAEEGREEPVGVMHVIS